MSYMTKNTVSLMKRRQKNTQSSYFEKAYLQNYNVHIKLTSHHKKSQILDHLLFYEELSSKIDLSIDSFPLDSCLC